MNANWKETLAAAGADLDDTQVAGFGDPAAELLAARNCCSQPVLCPLTHLAMIRVAGDDAADFLHNQLTSDVRHLASGGVQHSAWCSAKGRMLASFIVWRDDDAYWLALAADLAEAIARRLQMFVLRARVNLAIATDRVLLGLAGGGDALAAAGLPEPAVMQHANGASGEVLRIDEQRVLIALPAAAAGELWQKLAGLARPVGAPAWRWLDIRAGLPLVTAATREQFVPQMANFERIGGVSFHKGCYPGQEIVARTQYLGKVKRHLFRLRGEVAMTPGTELFSASLPDQACGMIVTGSASPEGGYEALAVLMEAAAENGVQLAARDGATVTAAPVAA